MFRRIKKLEKTIEDLGGRIAVLKSLNQQLHARLKKLEKPTIVLNNSVGTYPWDVSHLTPQHLHIDNRDDPSKTAPIRRKKRANITPKLVREMRRLKSEGVRHVDIVNQLGVSMGTVSRYTQKVKTIV